MARLYRSNRDFLNKKIESEKQQRIEENKLIQKEYDDRVKAAGIKQVENLRAKQDNIALHCVASFIAILFLQAVTIPIVSHFGSIILVLYICILILSVFGLKTPEIEVEPPKFKEGSSAAEKGKEGEETVLEYLSRLPEEYIVIDDIVIEKYQGNIDHVVIGPTGIFVIETKNWSYRKIRQRSGVWYSVNNHVENKIPYKTDPVTQVLGNAIRLREELQRKLSTAEWIEAIVVFTNPLMEFQTSQSRNVSILKPYELNEEILRNKKTVGQETIQKVSEYLIKNYTSETTHEFTMT
ncbi:hypothetical protein ABH15_07550 [Methanoculleus taiwanensis]|uniref:NERD domain-containing protein n=1 Tax=Methanoculleus taiwanensis TaxID=1550565 RepID=A0A498GZF6_9EURY|nr:nuclease-related domain-containing protein [Methanoculleus taiwanensis]RXE56041.1 hypothetical protein ABH15_07550 [Methanoculleus taiwanensis]